MELTGGRIVLREFTEQDAGALLAIHADPRVLRYYDAEVGTPAHARMLVGLFIQWAHENPRVNFQLAIMEAKTSTVLGSCGIRTSGRPKGQADFGIGIDANYWERGLAREAARLILGFGFSELDLREVRGVAVSQNEGVTKFATRLGFTRGIPRHGESWMTERGWDAVDWVMTREAWERQAAAEAAPI
jgi:RimJ/RimL family protein N-acetyltransferase